MRRYESWPAAKAAARYLACSIEVLQWYAHEGRITTRDRRGVTVLLVEHHMNLVMRVSDQVVALDFGRVIADGDPDAVRSNPEVVRAYLGSAS